MDFFQGKAFIMIFQETKKKVINGLPLEYTNFKIYYDNGKIHYKISLKNGQIYGDQFDTYESLLYTGNFRMVRDKEKGTFYDNHDYIYLIKEGNGETYNKNGKLSYKGNFKDDSFNGEGIQYNYDNSTGNLIKYQGSYLNGRYNGKGILYFDNSKIKQYDGHFLNGLYEGDGIKYNENGEVEFKGIFKSGWKFSGFETSQVYIGDINEGVRVGKGKIFIYKKLRFEGTFKNGKYLKGIVYTISNKKFFEGTISDNNEKVGKFFNDEFIYEGKFEDFCKNADYIIDFTNDCEINFEGEYKNGMRNGKGKDYLTGYEGEYLYGMYHGKGKLYGKEGEFKNGKKTGYWKEDNFEGEYKYGLRNGKGKENYWTGYYVNNYLHGNRINGNEQRKYIFGEEANFLNLRIEANAIYFNDIKEYEGDLINGIKNGQGIEYYKNNKKRYEGSFISGNHHGYGKEYYDNEILRYEGEFRVNEYNGKGTEYDENGQKLYEGEFKNGKYNGKGKLFRNGKLKYEGDFVDDKLQGKGEEFDEEGKLLYSGDFKDNNYNGYGNRYLVRPYEGYWSNGLPDNIKQGLYSFVKSLGIVS